MGRIQSVDPPRCDHSSAAANAQRTAQKIFRISMSANSKIEWTEKTWNPIAAFLKRDIAVTIGGKQRVIPKGTRGWFCVKCSPGCANCYAEGINLRLGNGLTYLHRNLADIEFRLVNLEDPLKWRKPCMVFVNSMTDLFLEHIPEEMIDQLFGVIAECPTHTFQILTKRADRMRHYFEMIDGKRTPCGRIYDAAHSIRRRFHITRYNLWTNHIVLMTIPLPNVWLGVSVEDRPRKSRIDSLRKTPSVVRFLSLEPLLEDLGALDLREIDWVIIGGESGPKARPCNVEWVFEIVRKCKREGIPVFVKQLGRRPIEPIFDARNHSIGHRGLGLSDRKGGDPAEWSADLRVREFPKVEVPGR
jgi:protein gp37